MEQYQEYFYDDFLESNQNKKRENQITPQT